MLTKAFLEEHAFKVDILGVGRLITYADLFVFGTEPLFKHVQSQIAIRPESYAGTFATVRESDLMIGTRTYPTTEYSGAAS
jgi:hypothetical protein